MATRRNVASRPWFVVGCGYAGARLARRLIDAGATVVIARRDPEAAAELAAALGPSATACTVDLAERSTLENAIPQGALVVHAAPPGRDASNERNLVEECAARGVQRIVYVSSTGVYPAAGGGWVDEDHPTGPIGERGEQRLAAETTVLEAAAAAGIEAVSLRVAGIYGPGRGVVARLRAGTYRVIGAGDSYVSRIHVDDLAQIIEAAATVDPLPRNIYNVADDEPTTSREHADAVAAMLAVPPAPTVDPGEVSAAARAMLGANRRIRNARLKSELGVSLRYPTWREGAVAQLKA